MKLRNIFTALAAAALALVGCQKESKFLDEVQVDKSIVAIPVEGGQDQITVTATAEWVLEMPEEAWFNVDLVSGAAGKTVVTFSAEATADTRELNVNLVCAGAKQAIKVLQMAKKVETPLSTCAQANAGETGKVYRVKGTVTSIANDLYGNMYITDETGTVYVYGTLYQGAEKQFSKHGIEVGDIVTVEGPQSPYNGSPQLKNVTVIEIEKSLIKLEKVISTPLPLEGGVATVLLTVKDGDFSVEIPEDAAWLTAGEPTNIGGATCVELTAAANEGGARKTTVTFKTTVNGKDYIAMADIEQAGAIKAVTVADFLAAAEGTSLYELTGVVKNIKNTIYGNFDLVDATGSVYVYGLTNNGAVGSNDKTFASLGINEGDKVTIVGTRAAYNGTAQVGGTAYLVAHTAAQAATIAEFLAAPVSADKWYKLTGTIESIVKEEYGNFYLTDGTSRVYVYGVTAAPVAKNDKSFPSLGVKAGDKITIVGTRAQYASSSVEDQKEQVGGPAYYVSHEAGAAEPETPAAKAERNLAFSAATASATLGEAFTAPTLSGETTGVAYSSSNTAVATIDAATGAVTLVAAGETTITATAAETETLLAGTANYTLTVAESVPAGPAALTVAEFLAKAVGDTEYQLTGVIKGTFNETYGNFYLKDETGEVLVYGLTATKQTANDKSYASLGLRDGDTLTLIGKRADYNGTAQVGGPAYYVSHVAAKFVDFAAAAASVAADATTYTIEVQSNAAWTATPSAGVTLDKTSGNGNASVVMTFAANTTSEAVKHTVEFAVEGATATFELTQKAVATEGTVVLLEEDFSSLTAWETSNVTSVKVNNLTYTTAGGSMYKQKGCLKFGKSTAASNTGVKLPKLADLSGATNVTLTFKAVSSDSGYTMSVSATGGATVGTLSPKAITKYAGGAINSGADTATKLADAFAQSTATFSVTIENVTADTEITIVASGSAKRWYLDDVKIEKN